MANASNAEAKRFSMECIETALLDLMKERNMTKLHIRSLPPARECPETQSTVTFRQWTMS